MPADRDAVLSALERVIDPELRKPVTELDMVRSVEIDGANVAVTIALTVAGCPLRSSFQDQVAEHVGSLPDVARVELRFDVMSAEEKAALTTKLRGGRPEKAISVEPSTRVIAVASGKGGVGKSSLTVNLAAALDGLGQRVGLIDADVYGHSMPHMLGISQRPIVVDKMIVPPVRGSLKFISIGNFLDDNAPVMWRGPMLHRALEQFLSDVHWGDLDTMVDRHAPRHRRHGDLARPAAAARRGARGDDAAAARQEVAARAAMMAQKTGHAAPRRRREHERRTSSARAAASSSRTSWACRCSARCRSTRRCARPATRLAGGRVRSRLRVGARDLCDRRGRCGHAIGNDSQASSCTGVSAGYARSWRRACTAATTRLSSELTDGRAGRARRSPAGGPADEGRQRGKPAAGRSSLAEDSSWSRRRSTGVARPGAGARRRVRLSAEPKTAE